MPVDILVVEDQPGWAALLNSAVRNGHLPAASVSVATNYDEAARLIGAKRFGVALLDYSLAPSGTQGAKTGLDVAALLRAASPQAAIFMISMVDPERVQERCEALGVTFIEKGRGDLEEALVRELREVLAPTS